jgi:hypothetical protein
VGDEWTAADNQDAYQQVVVLRLEQQKHFGADKEQGKETVELACLDTVFKTA